MLQSFWKSFLLPIKEINNLDLFEIRGTNLKADLERSGTQAWASFFPLLYYEKDRGVPNSGICPRVFSSIAYNGMEYHIVKHAGASKRDTFQLRNFKQ